VETRKPAGTGLALFAAELAATRAHAGLSQGELATRLTYSESLVSLIETGRRVPSLDFARRCDEELGTPGTFTRLQQHARMTPLPAWFRPWAEIEALATQLRLFEYAYIPGLLQTEDYARAVLAEQPGIRDDELAEAVAARMDRQSVLFRNDKPPLIWAVIDESVLARAVGGPKVMHEQLLQVVHLAEQPNITVQIVPLSAGAHCGLAGAFAVADVEGAGEIAYVDTVTDGYIVESASSVARVILTFDTLRSEALPRKPSRELIMKRAEDYGSDQS
jgi:transcriptional regulator with XRE-family HTH domain